MDTNTLWANMPANMPKHLRELADFLEQIKPELKTSFAVMPELDQVLTVIQPARVNEGQLLSQSEINTLLAKAGVTGYGPKKLSQSLKDYGFAYSDAQYYKAEGRTKRGFWGECALNRPHNLTRPHTLKTYECEVLKIWFLAYYLYISHSHIRYIEYIHRKREIHIYRSYIHRTCTIYIQGKVSKKRRETVRFDLTR